MAGTREFSVIPMSNVPGVFAIIDPEDYEKVSAFGKWYRNDSGYAQKKTRIKGKNLSIRMHRVVADPPKGVEVDHISGDRLDNRKANLRVVSHAINTWNTLQNKKRKYDMGLPVGIAWDNTRGKYIATRILRKRFDNLDDAIAFQNESELYEHEHRRLRPELPTGVSQLKGSKKYNAKFVHKTKKYYLGTFDTVSKAVEAINNMKKEISQ